MSKIEDLKNQYEKTKDEMEKLEKEMKKLEENKGKWMPVVGEEYYYIDLDLEVESNIYNSDYDKKVAEYNKIFKTEEEAEDYTDYLKALKKASYEISAEEWKNEGIHKYYIYYDHKNNKLEIGNAFYNYMLNTIYFKTEEKAQDFIDKYRKQILKYEFGIEKQEEILDEVEKEYLSNLIKPFKNKVKIIEKTEENELQYLNIYVENDGYITLPGFEANTMYKGMKSDKEYTLKELGLD